MPDADESAFRLTGRMALIASAVGLGAMLLYRIGPSVADPDLWHEMALAREVKERGSVPWRDDFSYSRTLPIVVHHEWGAGIVALTLARTMGGTGIVLAKYALTAALAAMTLSLARRRGAGFPAVAFLGPVAILLIEEGFSTIRAQLYSFVFFALLLRFLDDDRRGGRRWLLAFVPMVLAWVNVHGGFLAGAGVLLAEAVERALRGERPVRLVVAGLILAAMVAVNPWGWHYYQYLARAATMTRPNVKEWLPIWQAAGPAKLAVFAGSLAVAAYAVATVGLRDARGILALTLTAVAGAQRSRLLAFYGITWMAYVPAWVQATPVGAAMSDLFRRRAAFLAAVWSLATCALLARALPMRPWELRVPGGPIPGLGEHVSYPVGAVEYLRHVGFRGNVEAPFEWGAYVSWKLHPAVKVGMDGRYEVAYPEEVVEENYRLFQGEADWRPILDSDRADVLLVPNTLALASRMSEVPGWRRVYRDRAFSLYARPGLELPIVDSRDIDLAGTLP